MVALILAITPFLFYLYRYAPQDSGVWETSLFTLSSGGFQTVQAFVHAIFTKFTFILITTLWFFTSTRWWRFAILIPFTMFLFQFSGVINYSVQVVDEYDFWLALPVILPILTGMVIISVRLNKNIKIVDLKDEIEHELNQF